MKRTLLVGAACALLLTGCSTSDVGTPEPAAALPSADVTAATATAEVAAEGPAEFSCEELSPWFDSMREIADAMGTEYDPDGAAQQMLGWIKDPQQMAEDLGDFASVGETGSWRWDDLSLIEQRVVVTQVGQAADGNC